LITIVKDAEPDTLSDDILHIAYQHSNTILINTNDGDDDDDDDDNNNNEDEDDDNNDDGDRDYDDLIMIPLTTNG